MARFNSGWIKLYRGAADGDLGQNAFLWALWITILTWATWRPSKIRWRGKQREIPPGSVVLGIKEIADRWDCSRSVIQKHLHYLHDTGRIVLETCSRGTLITVCNWKEYQSNDSDSESPRTNGVLTECSPRVHGEALIEEVKKEERREREENHLPEWIAECELSWGKTLKRFGIERGPEEDREQIGRLIQRHGFDKTCRALLGAGFEEKSKDYDPAKHVSIYRLVRDPAIFDKFANLGAKAAKTGQTQPQTRKWGA